MIVELFGVCRGVENEGGRVEERLYYTYEDAVDRVLRIMQSEYDREVNSCGELCELSKYVEGDGRWSNGVDVLEVQKFKLIT